MKVGEALKKINPFPPMWKWFTNLWAEEYQLDIWYPPNNFGNRNHEIIILKSISKLTQTHIKGLGENGKLWELKTKDPFDYRVQRRL